MEWDPLLRPIRQRSRCCWTSFVDLFENAYENSLILRTRKNFIHACKIEAYAQDRLFIWWTYFIHDFKTSLVLMSLNLHSPTMYLNWARLLKHFKDLPVETLLWEIHFYGGYRFWYTCLWNCWFKAYLLYRYWCFWNSYTILRIFELFRLSSLPILYLFIWWCIKNFDIIFA